MNYIIYELNNLLIIYIYIQLIEKLITYIINNLVILIIFNSNDKIDNIF